MEADLFLTMEFVVPAPHNADKEAGDDWYLETTGEIIKEIGQLILAGGSLNIIEAEAETLVRMFDKDFTTIGDADSTDRIKASDARWSTWLFNLAGVAFGAT